MNLKNQRIINPKIVIPKIFKGKIRLFSNCQLSKNEVLLYNICLQITANHIIIDNIDISDFYQLNIFFTEKGELSFEESNCNVFGQQVYMVNYNMKHIRSRNNYNLMLFVYFEELVHYFWRIYDETDVKYKVTDLMKDIVNDFTIDTAKGWGLYGLQ